MKMLLFQEKRDVRRTGHETFVEHPEAKHNGIRSLKGTVTLQVGIACKTCDIWRRNNVCAPEFD